MLLNFSANETAWKLELLNKFCGLGLTLLICSSGGAHLLLTQIEFRRVYRSTCLSWSSISIYRAVGDIGVKDRSDHNFLVAINLSKVEM
jgi:hypothetical protein